MIKVQVQDNSKPQFVFVFGRKPADGATIMTSDGDEIVAGNFYEPITGTSGFRNMYPSMEGQGLVQTRYDASKLYESFFAESNICYNGLDCTLPAVQALVQQTAAGESTIDSPTQVSVPTLTETSTTPQGSSSYEGSITDAKPAVVLISSTTTTTPVTEFVVPSQATLVELQASYVAPAKQGSSSSYAPKSIGGSGSAAAKVTATTQTQTAPKTTTVPAPAPAPAKKASTTQVTKTIVAAAPAPQQKVTEIQYVAKPGVVAVPEKAELTFYDPNAGFFSNLLGEFVYDFGRVLKGVQAATS